MHRPCERQCPLLRIFSFYLGYGERQCHLVRVLVHAQFAKRTRLCAPASFLQLHKTKSLTVITSIITTGAHVWPIALVVITSVITAGADVGRGYSPVPTSAAAILSAS